MYQLAPPLESPLIGNASLKFVRKFTDLSVVQDISLLNVDGKNIAAGAGRDRGIDHPVLDPARIISSCFTG